VGTRDCSQEGTVATKSDKYTSKVPSLAEYKFPFVNEDGEITDVEAAKKAFHTLMVDKAKAQDAREDALGEKKEAESQATELQAELDKKSDPDTKAELDKARQKQADAEAKAAAAESRADRAEVAAEKGLTPNQAKRLQGSTKEELLADADEFLKDFGPANAGGGDEDENDEDETAAGRTSPRSLNLNNGGDPVVKADAEPDYEKLAATILPSRTI
jgi:hypothetical protein